MQNVTRDTHNSHRGFGSIDKIIVTKYQNKTLFGGPAVNGRVILREIRGYELY